MNSRDLESQNLFDVVTVRSHLEFEPLTENGQRYLAAADGLWLEAKWDWMYLRTPIAPALSPLPYGSITTSFRIEFAGIPESILEEFADAARARNPSTTAGWVVWNKDREEMMLKHFEGVIAGGVHLMDVRPELEEDEYIVCDLRSKGRAPGLFNSEDDKADAGDFKLAGVVGRCGERDLETSFRLCAAGLYIPLEKHAIFRCDTEESGRTATF